MTTYLCFRDYKVTYRDRVKTSFEGELAFHELCNRFLQGYYGHHFHLVERDEKGRFCTPYIAGDGGDQLTYNNLTANTGAVEIDGDFNTYYVIDLSDIEIESKELKVLIRDKENDILKKVAEDFGYSETKIELMAHFDDWDTLLWCYPSQKDGKSVERYIQENYDIFDNEDDIDSSDYIEINGKYYAKA